MTTVYTLRPMTDADLEFAYQVYASTRQAELAQTDWDAAQKDSFLRQQFTAQRRFYQEYYHSVTYQIIEHAGEAAGRLYTARWQNELCVMEIALLPQACGQGIGTHILQQLQREAEQRGVPLTIHVERFNPALRLYRRLGFELVEDRGVYLFLRWSPPSRQDLPDHTEG